jgi:predicted NBD/HSP70 family sugar kinase
MEANKIGNFELITAVNSRLVLEAVRVTQPTFRAAVARMTSLKPATVTMIVNSLIDGGVLRETPKAMPNSRFGRPPLMLEVNSDYKRLLAIDLEPDRIRVALTDLLANVLEYREKDVDRFATPDAICREIFILAKAVLVGVSSNDLRGAGVSLPGMINCETGVLISSTNMPKWRDVPIAQMIATELKTSVRVERSIRLAALYEKWSNPRLQSRTAIVICVRTGIGMCLLDRGELYKGNLGFDGEIGHTVIDIDGPVCECGSRGCLEAFIGAPAIIAMAEREIKAGRCLALKAQVAAGQVLRPELIYRLARENDADSVTIVKYIGTYLGISVANMINIIAPHEVIVCGSIDIAGDLLLDAMSAQIEKSALKRTRAGITLRLAKEQEKMPLLGAAVLVAQEMFELPQLRHSLMADIETPVVQSPNTRLAARSLR